jgi:hypothetical protein
VIVKNIFKNFFGEPKKGENFSDKELLSQLFLSSKSLESVNYKALRKKMSVWIKTFKPQNGR